MLSKKELKIGILGMTEGNGHPYSWSAIFNNYNKKYMDNCPFSVIPEYLYKQPDWEFGIKDATVTHICCNGYAGRDEAEKIALASNIKNVLDNPVDMIGKIDAVICATDIGSEHVERCRPFIESNIPIFIDKPLVDNEQDLKVFLNWRKQGKMFISCSSMRFNKELEPYYGNNYELGELMYICQPMSKKYENYGIHALEAVYPLLGSGFISAQNTGTYERAMIHLRHISGCNIHIGQGIGMAGSGTLLVGTKGSRYITCGDSFYAFKKQLVLFVNWLRTGKEPFDFSETVELMKLVIAGIRSREQGGRPVNLDEICN